MAQPQLLRLIPEAPRALCEILKASRGPVEPPIRSEIFGPQRFAQHGRSLAETHRATESSRAATFVPRLQSNIRTLREAHAYIGAQASSGYDISPAAEWLLDNFYLIEAQLREVHEGIPRNFFRRLPVLHDEPLAGLPRIYGVAWAFVAHTDGAFDGESLTHFLDAYQETRELKLSEMWALPTTLRVVLIENLRRLAERVATNKAAREVANLCADRIETFDVADLDRLLSLLDVRGVGRVFLAQIAQRFRDRRSRDGTGDGGLDERYDAWLARVLPDGAAIIAQQPTDQAADNLSVSNSVTSLRAIGDADWPGIVARNSRLMQAMLRSPVFEAEHQTTRDQTLHSIERLARRSNRSEVEVATALVTLMNGAEPSSEAAMPIYWLRGQGRARLVAAIGFDERRAAAWRSARRKLALPVYLGAILAITVFVIVWVIARHGTDVPAWLAVLAAMLMAFPASEMAVAVVNRMISESTRPRHLPRLELADGIPPEHRVLVVIPAVLTDAASTRELAHRLLLHDLANPERNVQLALLTDWGDADSEHLQGDDALLADARRCIATLNARHGAPPADAGAEAVARYIVLHRGRRYSETEQRWIGWERKRGKLEALIAAIATGRSEFLDFGRDSRIARGTAYVVTLDSDTQLPPGRLRQLVGVAAHPYNRPRVDPVRRRIDTGYGILQPRVVTPLPPPNASTLFHWMFAGQSGIDPYSAATSEVYQDVFAEGTFIGKGLLHVDAMHAVLAGRLPDEQVLSHDLLEGSLVRCAAVTDVTIIEDAPFHADVAASRVHRWTRGDWQLLPFMFGATRRSIRAINRWKMFDNLRRSLVAPMSLALIVLSLGTVVVSPWAAVAMVLTAFSAGPLMGAVAGFSPSRDAVAKRHFYREAWDELLRAVGSGAWLLGQLLNQALLAVDAIVRALYRMVVSRRHLLQWTTAAAAQAAAKTRFADVARQHWSLPAVASAIFVVLVATGSPHPALTAALCVAWAASPLWIWLVSRQRQPRVEAELPVETRVYLEGIARDTWRFFERCVGSDDRHLPPDNLQTAPHEIVAHRTSPTNIGLYLLSTACARQFGWIGTAELLNRLEATMATLVTLERHDGHFLNWYDTRTGTPLLPAYVSAVDSGNLCGHLIAVAHACRELAADPYDRVATGRAIDAARNRLLSRHAEISASGRPVAHPLLQEGTALATLVARIGIPIEPGRETLATSYLQAPAIKAASDELARYRMRSDARSPDEEDAEPAPDPIAWLAGDLLSTLRSAIDDIELHYAASKGGVVTTVDRLSALAAGCERLAWATNFAFLYDGRRHLFHIGYRVAEQQLDSGYYDLLASESRLTSLFAIAKGDVPVTHWSALGRPFYAIGSEAGLRSWSGSMFEYLMPALVLDEPPGSALHVACEAAIREQLDYAASQHVPWGISESAYAGRDHTLAYQYAPQGVPRSALRRTPADELVIAPYATAMAAQFAPEAAARNFEMLDTLSARGRYGFIEALDFTPARQSEGSSFTPVATFMSHHQGMSIVALANLLGDGVARRWTMSDSRFEAVASLLHERAPREISVLSAPPPTVPLQALRTPAPGMLRDVSPGSSAVEPTHALSNGRLSVTLRANGAGWARWGATGVTRWRDDALRDAYGSFFYLRWDRQPSPVSSTQHPAPDPAAHYGAVFHADRVAFDATWSELHVNTLVWVSPEDDIEFRQVTVRNLSERTIEIELMSAFEVTLADPRADETHPAFSNLFVRAEWQPAQQALLFERKARLVTEHGLRAAHFIADTDAHVVDIRAQTDRQKWLGRNRGPSRPLASFARDRDGSDGGDRSAPCDTGLDPVSVLAVRLRIPPAGRAQLTFATGVSESTDVLRAMIDKYRQVSHVQRASLMSATLTGIQHRTLRLSAENFAAIQTLTTALVFNLTRVHPLRAQADAGGGTGPSSGAVCDRRTLWRFGISGDRPIVLVSTGATQGLGLLRTIDQALRLWSWAGIPCDLIVLNAEPTSYLMETHRGIAALRDRNRAESVSRSGEPSTGFHVLRLDELSGAELSTMRALARIDLHADGRPLTHHLREWVALHEAALAERHETSISLVPSIDDAAARSEPPTAATGIFALPSGEFRFDVHAASRPQRPWINVLSNPAFGAQLSEAGGGFTWAVNSRLNQLTVWSNDPVGDPPSEWFLIQERRSMDVWSVAPSAAVDPALTYRIAHGQGYTAISHRRGDLEVTATWCVDSETSVKQVRVRVVNRGYRAAQLRIVGLAEWMMGANLGDRATVHTSLHRQRLPAASGSERKLTALMATQRELSAGYGNGTAFLAVVGPVERAEDWTCDKRECFDANGNLILPDHFGQKSGGGLDPCAALSTPMVLGGGKTGERVFLLGYAADLESARQLATRAAAMAPADRIDATRKSWDAILGAATVHTPDPLFDALVNRWLLYQSVACRMWAKAGFYQAGGATGFRDQLQDAMALAWAAPQMLREQIVLAASRQFAEGDVQHWWHAPTGAGVRTHFSDDLLWMPYACVHYLRATGDASLLDQPVPFLEGAPIPEGAEDAYYVPQVGAVEASVYEHAARTVDRSLRSGVHGLPLMGTGDWNDGMNRVGHEGRGESVWLAWFLCRIVDDFAPIAVERGDAARANRWGEAAAGWRSALQTTAWDGEWFTRAYFDDGSPLGSHRNAEARIDLIAQSWAVLSGAATVEMQRAAMMAADRQLVDHDAALLRLLDPPLADADPSAGYIQAYPPGVRENGGQYSHAGVWALMAQAGLARLLRSRDRVAAGNHRDRVYRYFTYLSPAHRARHPVVGKAYGIEPYVMAGDVYSHAPYVGRGGWSWYTGAAAWMHRAAIESVFGLQQGADELRFDPCLPSHWHEAELTLRRDGRSMHFALRRGTADEALARSRTNGSSPPMLLLPRTPLRWRTLDADARFVIPLLPEPAQPVVDDGDRDSERASTSAPIVIATAPGS